MLNSHLILRETRLFLAQLPAWVARVPGTETDALNAVYYYQVYTESNEELLPRPMMVLREESRTDVYQNPGCMFPETQIGVLIQDNARFTSDPQRSFEDFNDFVSRLRDDITSRSGTGGNPFLNPVETMSPVERTERVNRQDEGYDYWSVVLRLTIGAGAEI